MTGPAPSRVGAGGLPHALRARLSGEALEGIFDATEVTAWLKSQPHSRYLLLLPNEPYLTDRAELTPLKAAALWSRYEAVAASTGMARWGRRSCGPRAGGVARRPLRRLPYDQQQPRSAARLAHPPLDVYGLGGQLDQLTKYSKPLWVTVLSTSRVSPTARRLSDSVERHRPADQNGCHCRGNADACLPYEVVAVAIPLRVKPSVHRLCLFHPYGVATML